MRSIIIIVLVVLSLFVGHAKADYANFKTPLSFTDSAIAVDLLVGEQDLTGMRLALRPHIYTVKDVPYFDLLDIYMTLVVF